MNKKDRKVFDDITFGCAVDPAIYFLLIGVVDDNDDGDIEATFFTSSSASSSPC